ncbi:MAG: hypothetical protein OJF49_001548 [Ktedonobacterales bacterium]|jgi:uncharacterized membrane protein|nr:MAG: hypothetical protein OJF49_001548 [Ktedonobacterales bacterium]
MGVTEDLFVQQHEPHDTHAIEATVRVGATSPPAPRGLPARYAAVAVGSALLIFASAAYVPAGPGSGAPLRGAITVLATALGLWLLIITSMPRQASRSIRRAYQRIRGLALGFALALVVCTLLAFMGYVAYTVAVPPSQGYQVDVISFTHVNAELALDGRNPYTSDAYFPIALQRFPHAQLTPMRQGIYADTYTFPTLPELAALGPRYLANPQALHGVLDPRTLHSYPALSFLFYVPALWAGVPNILYVNLLVYWLFFAWLLWLTPVGWRHWGALAAGAAVPVMGASLFLDNEIICVAFILLAWHFRDRRWLFAMLLGLGCAFKQYCWFFAPFLLLAVLIEHGWREAFRRSILVFGVFLLPNLPYLIASPGAWWESLWLPMNDPMFPMGQGLIALSTGHLLPLGPQSLYAALEGAALCTALYCYWRWHEQIGDAALLLAILPLFFAYRSGPPYFALAPWLALYAVNRIYTARRAHLAPEERMAGSAYALAQSVTARLSSYPLLPPALGRMVHLAQRERYSVNGWRKRTDERDGDGGADATGRGTASGTHRTRRNLVGRRGGSAYRAHRGDQPATQRRGSQALRHGADRSARSGRSARARRAARTAAWRARDDQRSFRGRWNSGDPRPDGARPNPR